MKKRNYLTAVEEGIIKSEWSKPKEDRPTQQDLALRFNVAPVTVRRALAEEGMVNLKGYQTKKDHAIIEFLKSQGLHDVNALRNFIVRARTNATK